MSLGVFVISVMLAMAGCGTLGGDTVVVRFEERLVEPGLLPHVSDEVGPT